MSEARRKWWMRAVAAVIGGGGTAAGAWVGLVRPVHADQNTPPAALAAEPPLAPKPVPPEPFERPRDTSVVPAAAAPAAPVKPVAIPAPPADLLPPANLPVPAAPALPAVPEVKPVSPVVPVAAPVPFPPASVPPLPAPAALPTPKAAAPAEPEVPALPALPSLPNADPVKVPPPAPPALPAPEVAKPAVPAPPKVSAPPVEPPASLTPPAPVVPVRPPKVAAKGITVPSGPDGTDSAIPGGNPVTLPAPVQLYPPAPAQLTPPAPAPRVAELALPAPPTKPGSGLPTGNGGINVKSDAVSGGSVPVAPTVPVFPTAEPVKTPALPAVPAAGKPDETPGTTVSRPVVPEAPLRPAEKPPVPLPTPNTMLVPTPGDHTMIPLSRSAAAAVIGGMLLTPPTAPVRAAAPVSAPVVPAPTVPAAKVRADEAADNAELKAKLDDSNRKLATIQDQLTKLTELLNGKRDEKGFPLPSDPGLVAQMRELKDRLAAVEKRLDEYKTLKPTTPVTPANPIVDAKTGKGTVRVVNEYPVQISIVINGTSHRVAPSRTLDVDVNAGEFSYQLLESGAAMTKSVLKEKETVTLRIK